MSLPFLIFLVAWLAGVVMTFIPAMPATLVIYLGAAAAVLLDGFQAAQDLPFLIVFGILTLVILNVDNLASAWGARKYGGGKEAMWGALIGGIAGIFIPFGLIVGPLLGALIAELAVVRKPLDEALRSAWGTLIGLLTGIAAKAILHVLMGLYILWRLWNPAQSVFG